MPRIARMIVKGEDMVYHVISRTTFNGYVIGDIEKEYLLKLIKKLSSVYLEKTRGRCSKIAVNIFSRLKSTHPLQFTEKSFTNPIDIGRLTTKQPSPTESYPSSRSLSKDFSSKVTAAPIQTSILAESGTKDKTLQVMPGD